MHCEKHKEFERGCPECIKLSDEAYYKYAAEENERQRKNRIYYALRDSLIPDRFQKATLDNYITENEGQKKALTVCREYVANYKEIQETGSSLFLCGSYGTGKTHLAIAVLHAVIEAEAITGIYTTTMRMLRDIRSSYQDGEISEQDMIDKYVKYPLLVLDEVGVQLGTESEKLLIYEVINGRYENYRSTILLSNLSFQEMTQYMGARSIDRLKSKKGSMIVMDWESWRGK